MPLVNCRDCNNLVSSEAEACPHCGCPLSAKEATSKIYKSILLFGVLLVIAGVASLLFGLKNELHTYRDAGYAIGGVGIAWVVITRMAIWWMHG